MLLRSCALLFVLLTASIVHAQVSSENNQRLKDGLQKFPQADANKDGILTQAEARAFVKSQRANKGQISSAIKPTHADVKYGRFDRNVLDLWLVESKQPTPLLICIHGGGFSGGDKKKYHQNESLINTMHQAGISVAAINYRLTEGGKNPYPKPMHDGARAVQYLRYHAEKYNLDKTRFGATGGSAGGCMLMWIGFHDDLADPKSSDPIERESTRLTALAPTGGQSCIHMPTLLKWFNVTSLREHSGGRPLFGIPKDADVENLDPKFEQLALDASPITHLTNDDPACYMQYGGNGKITEDSSPGAWVHHPMMGFELQKAMVKMKLECHVNYNGGPAVEGYSSQLDFLIKKLTAK